jgi:hypothetical protein
MICSRCHSPTVTWRGPLAALTHTECSQCGGINCQLVVDDFDHGPEDDDCPNCGGDGVVYSCFDECACVDPESGCDECERACDWCKPRPAPKAEA